MRSQDRGGVLFAVLIIVLLLGLIALGLMRDRKVGRTPQERACIEIFDNFAAPAIATAAQSLVDSVLTRSSMSALENYLYVFFQTHKTSALEACEKQFRRTNRPHYFRFFKVLAQGDRVFAPDWSWWENKCALEDLDPEDPEVVECREQFDRYTDSAISNLRAIEDLDQADIGTEIGRVTQYRQSVPPLRQIQLDLLVLAGQLDSGDFLLHGWIELAHEFL